MISINAMVTVVLTLIVYGLVAGLLLYLIDVCETPEPWRKFARIAVIAFGVLVLIGMLLSVVSGRPLFLP